MWQRLEGPIAYSDFDLYVMGLLPAAQVKPARLLHGAPLERDEAPAFIEADSEMITIDQIIAAEGPRVPDAAHAPHELRQAFIYLQRGTGDPDPHDLARLEEIQIR